MKLLPVGALPVLLALMIAGQLIVHYGMSSADALQALRLLGPTGISHNVALGLSDLLWTPFSLWVVVPISLLAFLGVRPGLWSDLLTLAPILVAALWLYEPWRDNQNSTWTFVALMSLLVLVRMGSRQIYGTLDYNRRTSDWDQEERSAYETGGFLLVAVGLLVCASVTFVGLADPAFKDVTFEIKSEEDLTGKLVEHEGGYWHLINANGELVSVSDTRVTQATPRAALAPNPLEKLDPPPAPGAVR